MHTCDAVNLISRNENALEYFNFKNFPLEVLNQNIIYTQVDYLAEFEALLKDKVHDNTSTEVNTNSQ